jgi:hypothetical protein
MDDAALSALVAEHAKADPHTREGIEAVQRLFFSETRLWWDDDEGIGQGRYLVFTPELYKSVLERSAPLVCRGAPPAAQESDGSGCVCLAGASAIQPAQTQQV